MTIATARVHIRPVPWLACASSMALLLGGCAGNLLRSDADGTEFEVRFRLAAAAPAGPPPA